jgi:hypothetical protein
MASVTKATRAAGATRGIRCLTEIEYGTGLPGELTISLGGTESCVKWLFVDSSKMTPDEREQMHSLCERIAVEQDHEKFTESIEALNKLLARKDHRLGEREETRTP